MRFHIDMEAQRLIMAMWVCAGVAVFMAIVTGLACTIPARRALRIQPIETPKTT